MFEFSVACPICAAAKAFRRLEDYKSRVAYDCPRCGRFRMGKMAYFELETRIPADSRELLARIKMRQLVKKRRQYEEWPLLSREEIAEIADGISMPLRPHEAVTA